MDCKADLTQHGLFIDGKQVAVRRAVERDGDVDLLILRDVLRRDIAAGGGHDGKGALAGEEIPRLPRVVIAVLAREENLLGDGSLKRSVGVAGDGV